MSIINYVKKQNTMDEPLFFIFYILCPPTPQNETTVHFCLIWTSVQCKKNISFPLKEWIFYILKYHST